MHYLETQEQKDVHYKIKRKPRLDKKLLIKQEQTIRNYITKFETGIDNICVLAFEASMGKSRITDSTLKLDSKDKYIYVKKFNDEQKVSRERILETNEKSILDELFNQEKVLLIDSSNSHLYENTSQDILKNAQVIIISHKKYQLISNNSRLVKLYSEGRNILIIDEFMEPEIYELNELYFREKSKLWPHKKDDPDHNIRTGIALDIENAFTEIIKKIDENKLNRVGSKGNMRLINNIMDLCEEVGEELLLKLQDDINKIKDYYQKHKSKLYKESKNNHEYNEYFNFLDSFMMQQIIFQRYRNNTSLFTLNYFKYWTLKNNLILDASGGILHEYKLNPLFNVKKQKQIYDYQQTTCHVCVKKSFQTNVQNDYDILTWESTTKFLKVIGEHITKNNKSYDKTFIVLYEKYEKEFNQILSERKRSKKLKGDFSINHYLNIVGKNDWRIFNKIYIPIQFNIPEYIYLLYYSFASGKPLTDDDFRITTNDNNRVFENEDIENIKLGHQLHHLYQTLKRVNRDNNRKTDFYLIMDDKRITRKIKLLFKNINCDLEFKIPLGEIEKETKLKKERKKNTIKQLLSKIRLNPNCKESYKDCFCNAIGIKNKYLKQEMIRHYHDRYSDVDMRNTFKSTACKQVILKQEFIDWDFFIEL